MWKRDPEWVHRTVFGQGLLAHPDGRHRTLQGLAATVWMVLDEPADDTAVLARLRSIDPSVDIDPATVTDALKILADAGVLAHTVLSDAGVVTADEVVTADDRP